MVTPRETQPGVKCGQLTGIMAWKVAAIEMIQGVIHRKA